MDKIETLFGWAMYSGIVLLALMLIPMVSSLNLYGETVIYSGGTGTVNLTTTALLLNQTTPQTVADGSPIFRDGITVNTISKSALTSTMQLDFLRTTSFNYIGISATDGGAMTDRTTLYQQTKVSGGGTILLTTAYRLYVGNSAPFTRIQFEFTTYAVGTGTIIVEYWNGGAWVAVSNLIDGTSQFTTDGDITFDTPVGWATRTIGTYTGYFIKVRTTTSSSTDANPYLIVPFAYASNPIFKIVPNPLDTYLTGGITMFKDGRVYLPAIQGAMSVNGALTSYGGFSATTGAFSSTLANAATQTATIPTLFVPTAGISLNRGAATTGLTAALIPIQYSPSTIWLSSAWNARGTAANNNLYFRVWNEPYVRMSGTGLVDGRLRWDKNLNQTAIVERDWAEIMNLGKTGGIEGLTVLSTSFKSESLKNGLLTSGTNWSRTGDITLSSNQATYSYTAPNLGNGAIYQNNINMTIPMKADTWYRFSYTTSGITITPHAFIDTNYTSAERIYLPAFTVGAGAQQVSFKTNSNPLGFRLNFTGAVGIVTLDSLSLVEIKGGNIATTGNFTGGGTSGIKIDQTGKTGINNTAPAYTLDVIGTINVNDNYAVNGTLGISKRITFSNSTVICTLDFTSGLLTATTCP